MKRLSYIITLILILAACAGSGRERAALDAAQAVINDRPDSALAILDSLEPSSQEFSRSTLRRWQLLRLMAQNKCDTIFRSDSLQIILTDYYDRHGTPNEKMWAHYLLGRAYFDMGEAPMAIKEYKNAVECADTLSNKCDFYTLCSIYGQISVTFARQHLHREQIEALGKYSHFSLKYGDIYNYIRGIELMIPSYYAMSDTSGCLRLTERCRQLYSENGMPCEAASVYPTAIFICIKDRQFERASRLMRVFESQSGLFDTLGNISKGREQYYQTKGMYLMGVGKPDSAEIFFRKLLRYNINWNYGAFKGLQQLYQSKNDMDSTMKYSALQEAALDSIHDYDQAEAVTIANSLYNYSRVEITAVKKSQEAERAWKWLIMAVSITLFTILISAYYYRRLKGKKDTEYMNLKEDYQRNRHELEKSTKELELYKTNSASAIKEKEKEIQRLQSQNGEYEQILRLRFFHRSKEALLKSGIVDSLRKKANGKLANSILTEDDLAALEKAILENMPVLHMKIVGNDQLSKQERWVCVFTFLGISNKGISALLVTSPQRITNVTKNVNEKLFGDGTAKTIEKNLTDYLS